MHFISADTIFNGEDFFPAGSVLVMDGDNIADILPHGQIELSRVEVLQGILSPGFINAHCHTELSHLKGKIPKGTGLPRFAKEVITIRAGYAQEEVQEHLKEADRQMHRQGIVACGDICNTNISFKMKESSGIYYHSFIELLGLLPSRADEVMIAGKKLLGELHSMGLQGSLAPHATYSTSANLMEKITYHNLSLLQVSSIHNEESEEEIKFMHGKASGFDDLYKSLQMDISFFKSPGKDSLPYLLPFLKGMKTLLVHNTFSKEENIYLADNKNVRFCFCPNANIYIENRLPEFTRFKKVKEHLCVGTDSLASNNALSMLGEANILLENSPFSEAEILRMLTSQGAEALNLPSHFGKLQKGKIAGLINMEWENKKFIFKKRIC